MKKTGNHKVILPGVFAHLVMSVLALVLSLCIFATAMTGILYLVMNRESIHRAVTREPAVCEMQQVTIRNEVDRLAEKYGFDSSAVMAAISKEELCQFNDDVISWWMRLTDSGTSLLAPEWPQEKLVEILMADEGFQASNKNAKSVASNKTAPAIASMIQTTVLPIRSELISFAMSKVLGKADISEYMAYLPYLPLLFAGFGLLCFAMILFFGAKKLIRGWCFTGVGFAAGGLLVLAAILAVALSGTVPAISAMSGILGLQLSLLLKKLALYLGIYGGAFTLVGYGLIVIHQASMKKLRNGC